MPKDGLGGGEVNFLDWIMFMECFSYKTHKNLF